MARDGRQGVQTRSTTLKNVGGGDDGPRVTLTVHTRPEDVAVVVDGELDLFTAPELNAALHATGAGRDELVLDLRGLTFIDSSGMAVLVAQRRAMRALGTRLRVIAPSGAALRAFELAGLAEALQLGAAA